MNQIKRDILRRIAVLTKRKFIRRSRRIYIFFALELDIATVATNPLWKSESASTALQINSTIHLRYSGLGWVRTAVQWLKPSLIFNR